MFPAYQVYEMDPVPGAIVWMGFEPALKPLPWVASKETSCGWSPTDVEVPAASWLGLMTLYSVTSMQSPAPARSTRGAGVFDLAVHEPETVPPGQERSSKLKNRMPLGTFRP